LQLASGKDVTCWAAEGRGRRDVTIVVGLVAVEEEGEEEGWPCARCIPCPFTGGAM